MCVALLLDTILTVGMKDQETMTEAADHMIIHQSDMKEIATMIANMIDHLHANTAMMTDTNEECHHQTDVWTTVAWGHLMTEECQGLMKTDMKDACLLQTEEWMSEGLLLTMIADHHRSTMIAECRRHTMIVECQVLTIGAWHLHRKICECLMTDVGHQQAGINPEEL